MTERAGAASTATARRMLLGAAAQAGLAGAYAWAVAVAPLTWAPGATAATRLGASAAFLFLLGGVVGERWGKRWVRPFSLWGVVLASAFTWSTFPLGLGIARIDPFRGVTGMLAWALYALAYAGPAMDGAVMSAPQATDAPLVERQKLPSRDRVYVLAATAIAIALQLPGWTPADPGRALLTRVVAVASGLAMVGVATDLATRRNVSGVPRPRKRRGVDRRLVSGGAVAVALLLAWAIALYPGSGEGPHP